MRSLNKKLKKFMVTLGVCSVTFSAGVSANGFCGYSSMEQSYLDTISMHDAGLVNDDDFSNWMHSFGGVTLNKTLTLLNDVDNIRGATYDPVRGEVIFVGEGAVDEQIDMDDLVVAMQSVFAMHQDPGVTFYTADRNRAFQTGLWDVTYFGAVQNRSFGQILFDADYVLKQLTLGIDPTGTPLTTRYPQLAQLGYKSYAERMFENNLRPRDNDDKPLAIEFWLAPKTVTLAKTEDQSDGRAFVFREMSMEVFVKILDATGQEADAGSYDSRMLSHAQALAAHITDNDSACVGGGGFSAPACG